ncbi:hypothetical protein BKA93DRAFT_785418 [Sparassis latifolia]
MYNANWVQTHTLHPLGVQIVNHGGTDRGLPDLSERVQTNRTRLLTNKVCFRARQLDPDIGAGASDQRGLRGYAIVEALGLDRQRRVWSSWNCSRDSVAGQAGANSGKRVGVVSGGHSNTSGDKVVVLDIDERVERLVPTSNATARAREPFSTALGLPICAEVTPSIEGTGGFFISDPRKPGKIYLVTARHVVFHTDKGSNELYQHRDSSQRRRNVLLFGDAAIEKHITAIESEIGSKHIIIKQLERRLEIAEQLDEEDAEAERNQVLPQLEEAWKAIGALEKFLADDSRDWKKWENRVLGYIVLSPPIGLDVREEGFTEDWAVIEIDDSKVDSTNFVGNVIDLGTTIPVDKLTAWMIPHSANPPSFEYPGSRLLESYGTISDEEMWKSSPKTLDHDNDPCIMVIKRGYASDLTVGRLNAIRSFTRVYFKGQPGQMSKEVAVLPRNYKSGAFSRPCDSGSAVVDGKGRFAGLLTGGAGVTEESDCTYLTSINFLLKRMLEHGLKANLSPSLNA